MPHLHEGTSAGLVPEWTATKVVAATACLSREHRGLVDAHLAELGQRTDATTARAVAESRLADLGVAADGWRHLLRDALGVVSAT